MYRSGDRPGDWAQIRAACEWIDRAALPWRVPSGNMQSWFLMRLRTLPGERPARSDPVVFEVALPPGSKDGPAVGERQFARRHVRHDLVVQGASDPFVAGQATTLAT